ncbi:hypothetical protein JOC76_004219 [Neobacillus cucumis]|nr:hypothetical protein [Neobacillus cucumis]
MGMSVEKREKKAELISKQTEITLDLVEVQSNPSES